MADETQGSEAMDAMVLLILSFVAFGTLSLDMLAISDVCLSLVQRLFDDGIIALHWSVSTIVDFWRDKRTSPDPT